MPEDQVLVCVGIDADVRLQVSPRERHDHDTEVRDEPVGLRADDVLLDVEVGIVVFGTLRQRGDSTANALRREEVGCIVGLGPDKEAEEHAAVALERLLVRRVGVLHRQVRLEPRGHLGPGGTGQVEPRVARLGNDTVLLHVRRCDAIVHLSVRRATAEREVVLLRQRSLEESGNIVVERRTCGVGRAEVLECAEHAVRGARRTILGLELRFHPGRVEPQAVAVVELAGAGLAALRRDDDGTVRRIDTVEGRGFRALQYGERLDVLGVQVRPTIREIDLPVVERAAGARRIGRHRARRHRLVVDRQAVDDHQRLVVAADLADATNDNGGRRPRRSGRGRDVDAGDTTLERVDEVLTLRPGDVGAIHRLLSRAQRPLLGGLPQGRHHDGIQAGSHPAELDVDDVVHADGAFGRAGPDQAELEHLPRRHADGVQALPAAHRPRRRAPDDHGHALESDALFVGYLPGHRLLLRER